MTIFTVPRYFADNFKIIQYNAIKSWLLLKPQPEIILCGDEKGVSEFAIELGIKHIPDVEISDKGTPLINSVFDKAQAVAENAIVGYFSSDIILVSDFLSVVDKVSLKLNQFMIVGQRWDLDVKDYINFDEFWEKELRIKVNELEKLHSPCGEDYHIFGKGYGIGMPSFIVGRPGWDNWFVAQALKDGLDVVDATGEILAIHQTHDYSHIGGIENGREGEEAMTNRKLAGAIIHQGFTTHANWEFLNGDLVKRQGIVK